MNIDKAIILSAGQGRRLSPLTDTRPKCLIDLSGKSVLHWQLLHLRAAGVKEVVVVTGFGAEAVEEEIEQLALTDLKVRTLFNPFYGLTDNLATCWLARDEMRGPFLLLNGDTLFEPAIASRLLVAPESAVTVTVDRKSAYDADDMKVLTDGTRLRAIGKTIPAFDAESIGFLRFSAEGAAAFVRTVEQIMRSPEGLKRWYLSVINEMAEAGEEVSVTSIQGLGWAEMDFPEDVVRNLELTESWSRAPAAVAV
ncbi:MAG: NTP transferase domain-containing protein [Pseudomonadota bacterium]|uniref:phosphocholine cytidylyltransferase family protein n=1 Tax=unclassified Phenylobacterium TaxID=2640670 RepID=UPI0006F4F5E7|nr:MULTISPECIES: NTP transferase domain-containing protein [unclassified Phenylobacterium]KRB49417.1 nucleotidyltransferase [Phenylobacterium sp. Root700]MBT9473650.1 NTP transferase domain-containing protein [Phenylobacterium sp.]